MGYRNVRVVKMVYFEWHLTWATGDLYILKRNEKIVYRSHHGNRFNIEGGA
jgi:hypothetical protein